MPGVARQVTLPLQLALDAAQGLDVVHGLPPEGPPDRFLVDVVQARARVILAERRFQLGQVGEFGQGRGGVAEAERLLAGHLDAAGHGGPVEVRAPGPERVGEPGHLGRQPGVVERAGHQPGELLALFVAERAQQAFRRGHPADQRVHQLLEVSRLVREQVAVALHEAIEIGLGVLAACVRGQHLVQVGEHVLDPLHRLRIGIAHDLPHAAELAVEHLAAQQLPELLEGLAGGGRPPVVVGQLPDGLGRVGGQRVEVRFAQPGLVARVGEQLGALLPDGGVEQGAGLFEYAVEASAAADLPLPLPHPAQHVIKAPAARLVPQPPSQQLPQRVGRVGPREYRVAHLVDGAAHVKGERQRVGAVDITAVPVIRHVRSRTRWCCRRCPWTACAAGTDLPG